MKVGDTLFMKLTRRSGHHRDESKPVTVTKVGRKWATLDYPSRKPYRVDIDTMQVDGAGYSSPGRCWLSELDCRSHEAAQRAQSELSRRLSYSPPVGVTEADIREAARLLRVELPE